MVQTFLEQGPSSGYGASNNPKTQKPHLYCGSEWVLRQSMDDQLLDENGDPVTYADADATPFRLRDSDVFVQAQDRATRILGEEAFPVRQLYKR